jgi:hypothetical protein
MCSSLLASVDVIEFQTTDAYSSLDLIIMIIIIIPANVQVLKLQEPITELVCQPKSGRNSRAGTDRIYVRYSPTW